MPPSDGPARTPRWSRIPSRSSRFLSFRAGDHRDLFQVSPDGAGVDVDRAVLVYVLTGSRSGTFSRLQDFEGAVDKWAEEFLWIQIALTRFGWRYEQAVFVFPYDTD